MGDEYNMLNRDEQVALLRRLVSEDRDVIEFVEVGSDLEDLFMRITQGVVQ